MQSFILPAPGAALPVTTVEQLLTTADPLAGTPDEQTCGESGSEAAGLAWKPAWHRPSNVNYSVDVKVKWKKFSTILE